MALKETEKMKVGIITIHRLANYGTALQAYALEKYLNSIDGVEAETIDYVFPNKFHKTKHSFVTALRIKLGLWKENYLYGKRKKERKFRAFRSAYLKLSKQYASLESIMQEPPQYDVYITGSDQVWNYKTLKNDPVMYCGFVPDGKKRLSFGASFANDSILGSNYDHIKDLLNKYSAIGVREKSAPTILEKIGIDINIPVQVTCDPTLLLSSEDYELMAAQSTFKPAHNYILCYVLDYAFNPQPALTEILHHAEAYYGCPIIQLGRKPLKYSGKISYHNDLGPCEFTYLFAHAKFVITSSFHGCMFSLISRVPFVAIGPASDTSDTRILDVLGKLHLSNNYRRSNNIDTVNFADLGYGSQFDVAFSDYVSESKEFIARNLFSAE